MTDTKAPFHRKLKFLFDPHRYKVLYGGRGGGKCLAAGTRVMMADGTLRPVESVRVGEDVMGPDSRPRRVLDTTRGNSQLYRVRQTSGMDYVVNAGHLLSVKKSEASKKATRPMPSGVLRNPRGRYPDWKDITTISVEGFAAQSKRWRSHFRGYRAGLIKFTKAPVAIDPYLLGLWLGDGTSTALRITTADHEIIDYCDRIARAFGGRASVRRNPGSLASDVGLPVKRGRFNPIWQGFREYGLNSNKHIPQSYQANSEEIRLSLLAGLIDTDGHMHNNCYEIVQVNERLARGIKQLADGLGFRTSITKKKTICTNNGKRGIAWRVGISGDTWRVPCLLPRKVVRRDDVRKNKDFRLSQLTIEDAGVGPWAGFAVDGDNLFLLEDGTVTHNSYGVARALLIQAAQQKLRVLCAREFQLSIKDSVHKLLEEQIYALGLSSKYRVLQASIRGRNGSEFIFSGLRRDVSKIRSMEGVDRCWIEEAHTVSDSSWSTLIPTIRKEGSEIWVVFNPHQASDPTYKRFVTNAPPDSVVKQIGWAENPWFPSTLRKEKDYLYSIDKDAADHVWGGQTRALSKAQVLYGKVVLEAFEPGEDWDGPYQGVDWGFAVSPTCMVRLWIAEEPGTTPPVRTLYVEREAFGVGVEITETAALFDSIPGARKYVARADCARPETISHMQQNGYPLIEACEKGPGSVEDGVTHLRGYQKIVIHPRCVHAAEQARLWSYKKDRLTDDVLPILIDKHDDIWDASRYALEPIMKQSKISTDFDLPDSPKIERPWNI